MKNFLFYVFSVLLATGSLLPQPAFAQTAASRPLPADVAAAPEYKVAPLQTTYPMLRLSPDKPEIIRLDADARSVLVGNPAHLNAVLDNTRTIVLVPRDPGATYFTVIGHDGSVIMERYVIVAGPAHKYIRIRRACPPGATGCNATSVYYCPDLCYETEIMGAAQGQPGAAPAPPPTAGSGNYMNGNNPPPTAAPAPMPDAAPAPTH